MERNCATPSPHQKFSKKAINADCWKLWRGKCCMFAFVHVFFLGTFAHHKIRKLFPLEFSLEQHSNYLIFFQQLTFLSQSVVRADMFGFFDINKIKFCCWQNKWKDLYYNSQQLRPKKLISYVGEKKALSCFSLPYVTLIHCIGSLIAYSCSSDQSQIEQAVLQMHSKSKAFLQDMFSNKSHIMNKPKLILFYHFSFREFSTHTNFMSTHIDYKTKNKSSHSHNLINSVNYSQPGHFELPENIQGW